MNNANNNDEFKSQFNLVKDIINGHKSELYEVKNTKFKDLVTEKLDGFDYAVLPRDMVQGHPSYVLAHKDDTGIYVGVSDFWTPHSSFDADLSPFVAQNHYISLKHTDSPHNPGIFSIGLENAREALKETDFNIFLANYAIHLGDIANKRKGIINSPSIANGKRAKSDLVESRVGLTNFMRDYYKDILLK